MVRAWRWLASLDLTKPPAPLLRWLGVVLTGAVYAAVGAPRDLGGWIWAAVLGGALILPDVAGFAVGGFRLDLKQAQDDIATLRQEVNAQARASSAAGIAIGNDAIATAIEALNRAAIQAVSNQATGTPTPWPSGGGAGIDAAEGQPNKDVVS